MEGPTSSLGLRSRKHA